MDTQKIRIKIGQAEFEAEGPTELVQSQFAMFMEAVEKAYAEPSPRKDQIETPADTKNPTPENLGNNIQAVSPEIMSRVFHDNGDFVSLSATPSGEDRHVKSILILLYGFAKIKGQPKVTGVSLKRAMRQSGVVIDRVDRIMDPQQEYVLAGGSKRGKRYSLNNRGIQYVEGLIRELV